MSRFESTAAPGQLDALYALGYRGHVDFVDDNLIGNKRRVKEFLPHLQAWLKRHRDPFEFTTEATINLADDAELLTGMRDANFFSIFVGIESPDTVTLLHMQKPQNTRRVLQDSVEKIYRAGMFVNAGFILGFDTETEGVAEGMIRSIEDLAIPVCMAGLLYAQLLGGAVLTETIFSWPGVGNWLIHGVQSRDYPVVQGGILLVATIVITVNLVVDLLYGVVNPRIRHA